MAETLASELADFQQSKYCKRDFHVIASVQTAKALQDRQKQSRKPWRYKSR
ncbi:hypothetical protein [Pedobacter ginsengisoli]|uniref:hypothetical protein n=1 Tax=Pedobacter ginsengisoli TaxID=363852 RepID=UPI00254D43BD|nr:hypothetical protein [Pedobacter ginsengisoli]